MHSIKITESNKGKPLYCIDEIIYWKEKETSTTIYLRCSNRDCSGRAVLKKLENELTVTKLKNHDIEHIFQADLIKRKDLRRDMKKKVTEAPERPLKRAFEEVVMKNSSNDTEFMSGLQPFHICKQFYPEKEKN